MNLLREAGAAVLAQARSVRAQVLGWVLLLAVLGMVVAGATSYAVSKARVDERIDLDLAQEVAEFREIAEAPNPRTGQPWPNVRELLVESLRRQVPDEHQTLLALIDGRVAYAPAARASVDLADDPQAIAVIASAPAPGYGTLQTGQGDIRFATMPVEVASSPGRGTFVAAYATADEHAELLDAIRTYAYVATGTLLVVALGGWLVAGRLLAPIREVRRTAQRISETDLSRRIPERGRDDVSDLARTFNAMLDRLEGAFSAQRQLLDDVGHELRTPLTILRGHLELLDADDIDDVERTRALLLDELDRMGRLVDDLVLLARAERPDFLVRSEIDLEGLTADVLNKARRMVNDRRWTLDSTARGIALGDGQRLTQALLQLVDNAVKHTRPGDQIAVGSTVANGRLRLWVRDTGVGLSPDDAERIFQRFVRGSGRHREDGSGLGLSIVRAIAEAHGGQAVVHAAPGRGATFTIDLPLIGRAEPSRVEVLA